MDSWAPACDTSHTLFRFSYHWVIYFNEHRPFGIPPLILLSAGWQRSTINPHLFGWWFLGMTPKRLMCSDCWPLIQEQFPPTDISPLYLDVEEHSSDFAWQTSMGLLVAWSQCENHVWLQGWRNQPTQGVAINDNLVIKLSKPITSNC